MDENQLAKLLSLQADRLVQADDPSRELLAQVPAEGRSDAAGLFGIARRLQQSLRPAAPRPAFVAELKRQLVSAWPAETAAANARETRRRELVWAAAGVGGVISAVGLGFLTFRAATALATRVSGIIGQRSARPALTKAQPAP